MSASLISRALLTKVDCCAAPLITFSNVICVSDRPCIDTLLKKKEDVNMSEYISLMSC